MTAKVTESPACHVLTTSEAVTIVPIPISPMGKLRHREAQIQAAVLPPPPGLHTSYPAPKLHRHLVGPAEAPTLTA